MQAKQIFDELNAIMGTMRDGGQQEAIASMQDALSYALEKIHIYEQKYTEATGKKRIELNDGDRRRLASRARKLNLSMLEVVEDTWEPETIMKWYRTLIADKYNGCKNRQAHGRNAIAKETVNLVLKLTEENPCWGYARIANYCGWLGNPVSARTVKRIMNDHGLHPDGWRSNGNWERFYNAHLNVLAACDFATYELMTPNGLQREHILFFEDVTTREVWLGGIAHNPNGDWMAQVARNQTDAFDGRLLDMKYLICDNDPLYKGRFEQYVCASGCKIKRISHENPEMNGYIESFIKTIKMECLNHLILTSEEQLRYVVNEFLEYYNHERPHSGLDGRMIKPYKQDEDGEIVMFPRLGGLLKCYRRVKKAS